MTVLWTIKYFKTSCCPNKKVSVTTTNKYQQVSTTSDCSKSEKVIRATFFPKMVVKLTIIKVKGTVVTISRKSAIFILAVAEVL